MSPGTDREETISGMSSELNLELSLLKLVAASRGAGDSTPHVY